jgi:hypothetical protein
VEYPGSGEVRPAAKKKMNIDERLEALTQSLELLASLHKDDEQRNEKMRRGMEEMRRGMEEMHQGIRRDLGEMARSMTAMMQSMSAMMESIGRLGDIARAHNGQLAGHETRIERLEGE